MLKVSGLEKSYGSQVIFDNVSFVMNPGERIGLVGRNGHGKTTLFKMILGEEEPDSGVVSIPRNYTVGHLSQHIRFTEDTVVSEPNLLLLDEPTNHLDMDSIDSLVEAIDAFDGGVIIVTHSELILNSIATRLIVFDGGKAELFEGTYQEFLDRVGWENEREGEGNGSKPSSRQNKNMNKKEMRRLRAQLAKSRSKTLGPLQTKIAEMEKTIMLLEKDVEKESRSLVEASEKGDGEAISKLSIAIHNLNGKIETLFKELESLTAEHEAKTKEFEQKLAELQ